MCQSSAETVMLSVPRAKSQRRGYIISVYKGALNSRFLDSERRKTVASGQNGARSLDQASQGAQIEVQISRGETEIGRQLVDFGLQLHQRLSHFLHLLLT